MFGADWVNPLVGVCGNEHTLLQDGTTDKLFHSLFNPIISKIIDVYDPGAIVLQCGADSLAADRLGNFSMTISGLAPLCDRGCDLLESTGLTALHEPGDQGQ